MRLTVTKTLMKYHNYEYSRSLSSVPTGIRPQITVLYSRILVARETVAVSRGCVDFW